MGWAILIIITDYRNSHGLFSVDENSCKSETKITIGSVINPDNGLEKTSGYHEKLSCVPNSALRMKILSSTYHLYACGKISMRALILNQNPNFSR
jgi:hypothetical protein